jgi:hypothetical protein
MWPRDPAADEDPEKAEWLHTHTALSPRAQQFLWPDPKSCGRAIWFCCKATSSKFSINFCSGLLFQGGLSAVWLSSFCA